MSAAAPPEARAHLVQAAVALAGVTEAEGRRLAAAFGARAYGAREPVALPGGAAHDVLFVHTGLLRFYYPGAGGKESNKAFVAEGEFAGALGAAALGVPPLYGIEALEPSVVLSASCGALAELMDRDRALDRFGRRLAETILARKERRARSLLQQSAAERYADLVRARPDLVQRVPQYEIASYLGVTDVHLSRVRRAEGRRTRAERAPSI